MRKPFFFLVSLLFVFGCTAKSDKHVYENLLEENENDEEGNITNSHLDMLRRVVGSKEEASKATAQSYQDRFSRYAAKLMESKEKEPEDLQNAVYVVRDGSFEMHTTRSIDYIGLNIDTPNDLLQKANMGDGVIIGIIDTGIWPESMSFSDAGLGPIPPKWKGKCQLGDGFDPAKHCNKKIIGATYYKTSADINGWILDPDEYISARDGTRAGHGTHMASVAAGAHVSNVSFFELGKGTARGAAPNARLAIYKACWKVGGYPLCEFRDLLDAYRQAVDDGVDVILSAFGRNYFPTDYVPIGIASQFNSYSQGSFYAMTKGVPVIASAGNSGPQASTVVNTEAWMLTVGASTVDRSFPTPITLGDNTSLMGEAYQTINTNGFLDLGIPNTRCEQYIGVGMEYKMDYAGKVLLCFCEDSSYSIGLVVEYLRNERVAGLIYARKSDDQLYRAHFLDVFVVEVDYATGTQIYKYILSTKAPKIKVDVSYTVEGKAVPTKVASFSSRGPITSSDQGPALLKPDLVAPGANIIGAAPDHVDHYNGYTVTSGTSIAAAHVAGVMALLKAIHPDWSPSALKSALMTTARPKENGFPLRAGGCPGKPADPFDIGSGIINPNQAADPGLIYDITLPGYMDYLCAITIDLNRVDSFMNGPNPCNYDQGKWPRLLDINLPSIVIPSLADSVSLTRTVTNVGPVDSVYKPKIEHPMGTKVSVNPTELCFNAVTKMIKFEVTVNVTKPATLEYTFGSLVWSDGSHDVRIPIVVKVESFKSTCGADAGFSC